MTGEFDDLFVSPRDGNQSWFDKIGDEAREWVTALAQSSINRNQEPNFRVAHEKFMQVFPKEKQCAEDTFKKHLRRAITRLSQ